MVNQCMKMAAAALTLVAWLLPLTGFWRFAAFLVPYLIAGYDVLWSAGRNILHGQVFDEQFLMAIATLGAFAIADYPEAAAVMLFSAWATTMKIPRTATG